MSDGAALFELFHRAAQSRGEAAALIEAGSVATYGELYRDITENAAALSRLPLPGAIAILAQNDRATLALFLACAALGRPAIVLDPALPAQRLARICGLYRPAAIYLHTKMAHLSEFFGHIHLIFPGDLRNAEPLMQLPYVDENTEFYWGLTSGTTGEPKLFARTHLSWRKSFETAEQLFSFPEESRVLIPGALHHSLFLYGAIHALCAGHSVQLAGTFRPSRLADAAREATHLYAVPFMLAELLKAGLHAPSLQTIFCGGAKLGRDVRQACEQAVPNADLVEFYGASETSFISCHSTRAPAPDGSVGRPFPGVSIEIRSADENSLPAGQEGEIFAASPLLFSRYVGETPAGRWFSAGDIGYLDEAGYLFLTGRTNRIINSRALKLHPEAIEAALQELPEIRRAAVIGLADASRGTVPIAVIEFGEGGFLSRGALSAHCRAKLGDHMCPSRYFSVKALPLTGSGKIAAAQLQAAFRDDISDFNEIR